jgi:MraZ protein
MFRGITSINIDTKGRMAIPMRYRESLNLIPNNLPQVIATIDNESPCLLLYPLSEWEIIEAKLQNLSSFNPAIRRIQRLLIGHATELEIDSAGRILLPPLLREYANLDKKAILLGQGKKFELWDEECWQLHRERWLAAEMDKTGDLPEDLQHIAL